MNVAQTPVATVGEVAQHYASQLQQLNSSGESASGSETNSPTASSSAFAGECSLAEGSYAYSTASGFLSSPAGSSSRLTSSSLDLSTDSSLETVNGAGFAQGGPARSARSELDFRLQPLAEMEVIGACRRGMQVWHAGMMGWVEASSRAQNYITRNESPLSV